MSRLQRKLGLFWDQREPINGFSNLMVDVYDEVIRKMSANKKEETKCVSFSQQSKPWGSAL